MKYGCNGKQESQARGGLLCMRRARTWRVTIGRARCVVHLSQVGVCAGGRVVRARVRVRERARVGTRRILQQLW